VEVEEQKKHQEQEYVVPGKVQGTATGSSANIIRSFSQSEMKSVQGMYPECLGRFECNLGSESAGYDRIGENVTDYCQVDVWYPLEEYNLGLI